MKWATEYRIRLAEARAVEYLTRHGPLVMASSGVGLLLAGMAILAVSSVFGVSLMILGFIAYEFAVRPGLRNAELRPW